jgi:hypothetical protein
VSATKPVALFAFADRSRRFGDICQHRIFLDRNLSLLKQRKPFRPAPLRAIDVPKAQSRPSWTRFE